MDYSRSRVRLGVNSSFGGGAAAGSGARPTMVKTYGRIKQRIANRESKVTEEFARVANARSIVADLLDSSSSDSDFEVEPTKTEPTLPPQLPKPPAAPKAPPKAKKTTKPAAPKSKPTSKLGSVSKAKTRAKAKATENVEPIEVTSVDTGPTDSLPIDAAAFDNMDVESATGDAKPKPVSKPNTTTKPKSRANLKTKAIENVEPVEVTGIDTGLADNTPIDIVVADPADFEAVTKGSKAKSTSRLKSVSKPKSKVATKAKPKMKAEKRDKPEDIEELPVLEEPKVPEAKPKPAPRAKAKPKAKPKTKSKSKSKAKAKEPNAHGIDADPNPKAAEPVVSATEALDSTPQLISLPTPVSRSRSSSLAEIIEAPASGEYVQAQMQTPVRIEHSRHEMQEIPQTPANTHSPVVAAHTPKPDLVDLLSVSGISERLAAAPSPISSGRVSKRRAARPKRSTMVRKLSDMVLMDDQLDDEQMNVDKQLNPSVQVSTEASVQLISSDLEHDYSEQQQQLGFASDADMHSDTPLHDGKRKRTEAELPSPVSQPQTPGVENETLERNGETDREDCSEPEEQPQRRLMGTRTIRFKAPQNVQIQTFELDEEDQPLDQQQSGEPIQQAHTQLDPVDDTDSTPLNLGELPASQQVHPMATPQRKKPRRLTSGPTDTPHSPPRMATPHRVVYSPVHPTTVIKPRGDAGLAASRSSLDRMSQTPAHKQAGQTVSSLDGDIVHEKASSSGQPRLSSGGNSGDADVEMEEATSLPFLPARRYVQKTHILAACGQTAPIDWVSGGLQACGVLHPEVDASQYTEKQIGEIESEAGLCKIGEATYSEVFSAQWRHVSRTRYDKFNSKRGSVKGERLMKVALKIIPFGNTSVKSGTGEPQTTLRDLYQEIGATLALSRLSERERAKLQEARLQVNTPLKPKERELGANFVKAFRVCICQGPLPAPLLRAWDRWKIENPELCENIRPDYYPRNQLFAVFVLEMGGETLENANISTWKEARSIIRQLALSMALAERHNRFEHRDLHWGNIMVARSNSNLTFLYQLPPASGRVKPTLLSIPSYKVRCTIIDYTLSRLHIDNDDSENSGTKPAKYNPTDNVFYVDLKDEALFQGEGDIQYDVYRQMRICSKSKWSEFCPQTNVYWLVYALDKILTTKSPKIQEELRAFAENKLGSALADAPADVRRAAGQELLCRWVTEFRQCQSSTQVLKCALLDLYKS
ncbi:hypothetical protein GGI15_001256 [Coemansia interrupta]|uniref:non-specific serine/threonine protein kinase n=1 Tax=Coemansia interrupta TaxID=1126814 RepID=A0A9W8LP23_9FUNG|nr:hypothetical protein GGI15_001256 [Coemansia interrupta]